MSKRITTKTDMTNKDLAIAALKASGLTYEEVGSTSLRIKSGALASTTLDLTTGLLVGDSDTGYRSGNLGTLRREYAEAGKRVQAAREGVQIKQRIVNETTGRVTLKCRMVGSA